MSRQAARPEMTSAAWIRFGLGFTDHLLPSFTPILPYFHTALLPLRSSAPRPAFPLDPCSSQGQALDVRPFRASDSEFQVLPRHLDTLGATAPQVPRFRFQVPSSRFFAHAPTPPRSHHLTVFSHFALRTDFPLPPQPLDPIDNELDGERSEDDT